MANMSRTHRHTYTRTHNTQLRYAKYTYSKRFKKKEKDLNTFKIIATNSSKYNRTAIDFQILCGLVDFFFFQISFFFHGDFCKVGFLGDIRKLVTQLTE